MLEAVEVIVAVETQGLMVNPGSLSTGGYQPLRRLCDVGRAGAQESWASRFTRFSC